MADKIDKLFSDYFSGVLNMRVKIRQAELVQPTNTDENVGGGRSKNNYSNPIENRMIREEEDQELCYLYREIKNIEDFLDTLTRELNNIMLWHYNTRDRHSWVHISWLLNKSVSQCQRDLKNAKQSFKESVWNRLVDN